jgi:predicted metalloprotease with PDZ domain
VLVAIDGLRVTGSNLDALLARYSPGASIEIHAFRRDELRVAKLTLDAPESARYKLSAGDKRAESASARKGRERWLQG